MVTHGVKYIGSKRVLIPYILKAVEDLNVGTMLDPFTGTTRVSQAFRKAGWNVFSGDLSWASEAYSHLFLMVTPGEIPVLQGHVDELNRLDGVEDWITRTYCDVIAEKNGIVRVWKPKNGKKADAIRNTIDVWKQSGRINRHIELCLVAILILALDAVDSTVGVQQAYLKEWAKRAENDLRLVVPQNIAQGAVGQHSVGSVLQVEYPQATLAYIDPPYSEHCYATYYHIWDSIVRWDKPTVALKTNRRSDRIANAFDGTMKSEWNSKKTVLKAFADTLERLPAQYVLISYSNESLISLADLHPILGKYKSFNLTEVDYKRNIMHKIGNAVAAGHSTNTEYLILVEK
jgi:adenine-specific DNA-methyltransferase